MPLHGLTPVRDESEERFERLPQPLRWMVPLWVAWGLAYFGEALLFDAPDEDLLFPGTVDLVPRSWTIYVALTLPLHLTGMVGALTASQVPGRVARRVAVSLAWITTAMVAIHLAVSLWTRMC